MKKLGALDKIVFVLNSLLALILLLSYLVPFLPPKDYPSLSVLSLAIPLLLLLNGIFVLYWALRGKRQFLLSTLVLLLGYSYIGKLFRFSNVDRVGSQTVTLMTYNVRLFNLYEWIADKATGDKLIAFIEQQDPDILCLQEFHTERMTDLAFYPHHFVRPKNKNGRVAVAIFSKYPIVNSGTLGFSETHNEGIYADILINGHAVRVYNLHLESFRIDPDNEKFTKKTSERIRKKTSASFVKQQEQAELFTTQRTAWNGKTIVCGDFNNTAYSYVYRKIRGEMKDTFEETGRGFGRTFYFKGLPLRIDYVLVDPMIQVFGHTNSSEELSDHYAVVVRLGL